MYINIHAYICIYITRVTLYVYDGFISISTAICVNWNWVLKWFISEILTLSSDVLSNLEKFPYWDNVDRWKWRPYMYVYIDV
jgi:hypothetical protein